MLHSMKAYLLAPLTAGLLLMGSAAAAAAQSSTGPVTIQISPQNGTSESGTATLTDNGDGTTSVKLAISGEPAGVSQPTHIHTGHGGQPDFVAKPKYPLTSTLTGSSTTTVKVALSTLLASPYAINLHKSPTQAGVYVACGNIVLAQQTGVIAGAPKTGGGGGSSPSETPFGIWLAAAGVLALGGLAIRRRLNS